MTTLRESIKRFWILLGIEFKAWRRDPITAMGGLIPPAFILLAFGLLFGGQLSFRIAYVNQDSGPYGALLRKTIDETLSPFGAPYYEAVDLTLAEAESAYRSFEVDGMWVIPEDFSEKISQGNHPNFEMYFTNYNDDRAKNHRIYSAEVLWGFYKTIEQPPPPLETAEKYPPPEMVEWFPVIAVGVVLLSFMLGGMMNIFMLTHKEQVSRVTLEFGLAPRSLGWVLAPKILLALVMGLFTGSILLVAVCTILGLWPVPNLWAVYVLAGLVILFWTPITLFFALNARYFAGAVAVILTGLTVFFIGGGLTMVRVNQQLVPWFAWLFPNTYAVDPVRDLVLFKTWPVDWEQTVLILAGFALLSMLVFLGGTSYRMRKPNV